MKKVICMFLAVLLVVIAGCSIQPQKDQNGKISKEQPVPEGTFQTSLDLCDVVNEQVSSIESLDVFFLVSEFVIDLEITFRQDGTYTLTVDEASVQAAAENLMVLAEETLIQGLEEELMVLQNEQTGDELEATYEEITMEQMLSQNGTTLEALKQQLREEMGVEGLTERILTAATLEGTFKAEEGMLYLSKDMQTEIYESAYVVYTLEEDVLTFTEQFGGEDEVAALYLFPIVFQKAS